MTYLNLELITQNDNTFATLIEYREGQTLTCKLKNSNKEIVLKSHKEKS